jgi:cytochrome c-type biogenesis protein CcmH/NrfG
MKRVVVVGLIVLTMIALFAANQMLLLAQSVPMADETMATANQLYERGQFAQAAQAYEQLAEQGISDSALFYNLGNAYFKQEDYGRAIVNYRRAQQLAPRDADIRANLNLARIQTMDEFEVAEESGLLNMLGQTARSWLSLNELAMATLGAWILFVLLAILVSSARARSAWRRGLQYGLVATAILLAVGVLALGSHMYVGHTQAAGVIVAAEVDVTSGPGAQYVTEFTLHGGAEVEVVESRGRWIRLALPGGEMEGWVPAEAVEPVAG